jgi:hypothetical protein
MPRFVSVTFSGLEVNGTSVDLFGPFLAMDAVYPRALGLIDPTTLTTELLASPTAKSFLVDEGT